MDTTASDFRTLASDIDRYIPPSSRIDEGYSSPTPNTAPRGSQPAGSRMWKRYLTDHLTEIAAHTDSNRERWVIAVYLYLGVCRKSGIVPFRTGGTPPPLSVVDPQQHTALHRLEVQVGKLLTMCNRMVTTLKQDGRVREKASLRTLDLRSLSQDTRQSEWSVNLWVGLSSKVVGGVDASLAKVLAPLGPTTFSGKYFEVDSGIGAALRLYNNGIMFVLVVSSAHVRHLMDHYDKRTLREGLRAWIASELPEMKDKLKQKMSGV